MVVERPPKKVLHLTANSVGLIVAMLLSSGELGRYI